MARKHISKENQISLLMNVRRRCCLCFGLNGDDAVKRGQIAHIDQDNTNDDPDNLAFLCQPHHDDYDAIRRQTKGITPEELKKYRSDLVNHIANKKHFRPTRSFLGKIKWMPAPTEPPPVASERGAFFSLLDSSASLSELRSFLRSRTRIIKGPHYANPSVMICDLNIGGRYIADFAFVNPVSGPTYLRLTVLGDLSNKLFSEGAVFTQEFNSALHNLHSTAIWCERNEELIQNVFCEATDGIGTPGGILVPRARLIYGRRSELISKERNDAWAGVKIAYPHLIIQTYDGFAEEAAFSSTLSGVRYDLDLIDGSNF